MFLDRQLSGKKVWDWFSLIAVPLAVLGATIWFTTWFTGRQSNLADMQHQDDIVETYISDMSNLLHQGLSASTSGAQIRQVEAEETVTTLQRLNAQHNVTVLQFLQNAQLTGPQDAVLRGADLSRDDLAGADLSGAMMDGTNLTGADLSGAILTGTSLSDAILTGADLSGTRLNGAILSSASLSNTNLSGADLSGADLAGANITKPQLDEARSCTYAILSAGLTCQQNPPIQLTYWYTESGAEQKAILEQVKKFQQQNPRIHINAEYKKFFQARAAFTAAAQDGNAPDVFRSDIGWTTLFASKGYLLNIDPYVSQSDLSDYRNAPLSTTNGIGTGLSAPLTYDIYNRHLYGLPQVTDFLALLYNKKELAEAGITGPPPTMAYLKADAAEIVQKKKAQYGFETGGTFYSTLPFLYACGGGMFDQHNNILVNNTGSVEGLEFLLNLENDHLMRPVGDFGSATGNMTEDFMNGKTAMIFDGPYDVKQILTGASFKDTANLGIAGIPTGAARQTGSPIGGQSYVISAKTSYPAQAYQFINFMNSASVQVAIAKLNHTLPTRLSAYQDGASSDRYISAFLSLKDTVAARPAIPQGAYLFDVSDTSIWAALTGQQSVNGALNAVADSWDQLGAGNLVPQSTFTHGALPSACG
jgi:arabinogalactan oligomer/maltooligosaccharide transport system substrate-binding protein